MTAFGSGGKFGSGAKGPQPPNPHYQYDAPYTPVPGNTQSAVALAISYLTGVGTAYQNTSSFSPVTEALTVNFALPVLITEVGFEALRVSVVIELWYKDPNNNWLQVVDDIRNPITLQLSATSGTVSPWYTVNYEIYPVLAGALQFRFRRVFDPTIGGMPYSVGMRNGLIERTIYTRTDGTMVLDAQQDIMGNTINSYIQDWDAGQAIDDVPNTFWRSMAQPSPDAVVSMYLDCRDPYGNAQLIDTLYVDPVYAGQSLNIYYSTDDTVGTYKLSPVTAVPTVNEDTNWKQGQGLWDIGLNPPVPTGTFGDPGYDPGISNYQFPMQWGPLVSQDVWFGFQWAPDFDPTAGPPDNCVLLAVTPEIGSPAVNDVQTVSLTGAPTGGTFTLSFFGDGTTTAIPLNASAATVVIALESLSGIGTGNVSVVGPNGGPWIVTFVGGMSAQLQPLLTGTSSLTGGASPAVFVAHTTPGAEAVITAAPPGVQYWPTIYYDVGGGRIVLELFNGSISQVYACPLSPLFVQYAPLNIVAGWSYDPNTVYISVTTSNNVVLGTMTAAPANLPTLMTLDGSIGFSAFRGLFTAHVIKLENYGVSSAAFQANPGAYVNPAPVLPNLNGNIPSTTLDNAIYAAAWTVQENGTGGSHESAFYDKTWVPIFANYVTAQGNLSFPQAALLKYLQLEFTNLTQEAYPVFDAGIQVNYNTFPTSVIASTAGAVTTSPGSQVGVMSSGGDIAIGGMTSGTAGNVNFLNPSTINAATNSLFGLTQVPVPVTSGIGTLTMQLPNVSQADIINQTRAEVASPWVFKRNPMSASTLAANTITQAATQVIQGVPSSTTVIANNVSASFNPATPSPSGIPALPAQGADWWIFPGGTLRMPARVMTGLTQQTSTVTAVGASSAAPRLRFNTVCVHRYATQTATRDAALGYFAGLREVQPYLSTYIADLDPPIFRFSSYNPAQWTFTNISALPDGPITTAGEIYQVLNPDFDPVAFASSGLPLGITPGPGGEPSNIGLQFWTETEYPLFDPTDNAMITDIEITDPFVLTDASITDVAPDPADYTNNATITAVPFESLLLQNATITAYEIATNNAQINAITTLLSDITNNAQIIPAPPEALSGGGWEADPSDVHGHWYPGSATIVADGNWHQLVSSQMAVTPGAEVDASVWVSWGFSDVPGSALVAIPNSEAIQLVALYYDDNNQVIGSDAQGLTYASWPSSTPELDGNFWIQIVASAATDNGFIAPFGAVNMALGLTITPSALSGQIWFAGVETGSPQAAEGTAFADFLTTSTFASVRFTFFDSGVVESDSMWAREAPADTNISNTQLAYYTDTIPDVIPAGTWADSQATWGSSTTVWGEPRAVVAITIDPNRVFQGNRVVHFTRAGGAEEAGISVRQETNYVSNGLFRIGAVFMKPAANGNQITIALRRQIDGVYIYQETFTPVVGAWYEYVTDFQEIPDSEEQVYVVSLVCSGDDPDELYLSNLYTEVAQIRYFCRLGGAQEFLHDVTQLAYADTALVSTTDPVQEFSIETVILTPRAFAYGVSAQPAYLK